MVHEKQIRNEESAPLLNQNTDTGTVLISTPLAYARGTVSKSRNRGPVSCLMTLIFYDDLYFENQSGQ